MSAKYDAIAKHLIEMAPGDWLSLCGHNVQSPVRVVDADLSTITTMADKVMMVDETDPWMAHFEFQASYNRDIGLRLLRYNVLIEYRHQLPVQSILILLRPESDGPAASGITRRSLPNGTCYYEFKFQTVRVWQLELEELLNGRIGTLPLAPISNVSKSELPFVIRRMTHRVEEELTPEKCSEFWISTGILMGTRYPAPTIETLLGKIINMRESSVIQAYLKEGREEGREEEARKIVLEVIRRRFGSVDPNLRHFVEAISDVARLESMIYRVAEVNSWDELMN